MTVWTRGIVNTPLAKTTFELDRRYPAPGLRAFVEYYWLVRWDLRGRPPHRQQILPHPNVHLTFDRSGARVFGVLRGRFVRQLDDVGWALGVRFRPGGFRPFLDGPTATTTDRTLDIRTVFGPAAGPLLAAVLGADGPDERVALVDAALVDAAPSPDPVVDTVARIVARVADDPGIVSVARLADRVGLSTRRLQRLFAEYVGVGPKWVIRRCRLHEAARRAEQGQAVDWPALAVDLGYCDQSHLVREFTATVGVSPSRYAKACAG